MSIIQSHFHLTKLSLTVGLLLFWPHFVLRRCTIMVIPSLCAMKISASVHRFIPLSLSFSYRPREALCFHVVCLSVRAASGILWPAWRRPRVAVLCVWVMASLSVTSSAHALRIGQIAVSEWNELNPLWDTHRQWSNLLISWPIYLISGWQAQWLGWLID